MHVLPMSKSIQAVKKNVILIKIHLDEIKYMKESVYILLELRAIKQLLTKKKLCLKFWTRDVLYFVL